MSTQPTDITLVVDGRELTLPMRIEPDAEIVTDVQLQRIIAVWVALKLEEVGIDDETVSRVTRLSPGAVKYLLYKSRRERGYKPGDTPRRRYRKGLSGVSRDVIRAIGSSKNLATLRSMLPRAQSRVLPISHIVEVAGTILRIKN